MKYEFFSKMFQELYHFQFFYANPCLNAPEQMIMEGWTGFAVMDAISGSTKNVGMF